MKLKYLSLRLIAILSLFLLFSCASSFERIRNSGDADLMLSTADAYYEKGQWQNAQILYESLLGAYRGKDDAERIYYNYARTYYEMDQYMLAAYYFKRFANTYPNSGFREEADYMNAFAEYKRSPKYRLDQTPSLEAIEAFQRFIDKYPNSERVKEVTGLMDELQSKLEKKAFEAAKLYYNTRNYQSAAHTFKNFARDFPNSSQLEEARYLAIKSEYLLAENSIPTKQLERYEILIKDYKDFQEKFPDSPFIDEAKNYYQSANVKIKNVKL